MLDSVSLSLHTELPTQEATDMPTIEVDDGLYTYLESKILGFGDTPSTVLRRELGLMAKPPTVLPTSNDTALAHTATPLARSRAPKTRLSELVEVGKLKQGQTLYFHDYQGKKVEGIVATVRGDHLVYKGVGRSMSELTGALMKERGYSNDSYRGPDFWFTADGRSVRDLWDEHLGKGG